MAQCTSSPLAVWPVFMCVTVCDPSVGWVTHTEHFSMGQKPAKRAVFELTCFVALSKMISFTADVVRKRTKGPVC